MAFNDWRFDPTSTALSEHKCESIADLLAPSSVPFSALRSDYLPQMRLERALSGATHNFDPLLAIHRPTLDSYGHLTYVILQSMSCSDSTPFLAMHYASRGANEPYAAALTASIAIRKKVPAHVLRLNQFSAVEKTIVDFALRMGTLPCTLSPTGVQSLERVVSDNSSAENIVMAIAYGGLVGRLAHFLSTECEAAIFNSVQFLKSNGWSLGSRRVADSPKDPLQKLQLSSIRTDYALPNVRGPGDGADCIKSKSSVRLDNDFRTCDDKTVKHDKSGVDDHNQRTSSKKLLPLPTTLQGNSPQILPTKPSPKHGEETDSNSRDPQAPENEENLSPISIMNSGDRSSFSKVSSQGFSARSTFLSSHTDMHALRRSDNRRLKVIPENPSLMSQWLLDSTGYSFPILSHIQNSHYRRSLGVALHNALEKSVSITSAREKYLSAFCFVILLSNEQMAMEFSSVCTSPRFSLSKETVNLVKQFAVFAVPENLTATALSSCQILNPRTVLPELSEQNDLTERDLALLILVKTSVEPWTADIDFSQNTVPRTVVQCIGRLFGHDAIVDMLWWLSLIQALHHLNMFYTLSSQQRSSNVNTETPVPFMGPMAMQERALQDKMFAAGASAKRSLNALSPGVVEPLMPNSIAVRTGKESDTGERLDATHVQPFAGPEFCVTEDASRVDEKRPISRGNFGSKKAFPSTEKACTATAREVPHFETIAAMLLNHRVTFAQLKVKHYSMLKIEKIMLGAAPNTDAYLAIYPAGFRTSMLIVPNMLNIPRLMFGTGTGSSVIGVAIHYSSRASNSRYCSLHTACFAMRRGIPAAVLQSNVFNEEQAIAVDAALRMSTFPPTMTKDCRDLLYQIHSVDNVEWIVTAIAMAGFLQKFVDTCGCQLEQASYDQAGDFLTSLGWGPGRHLISGPVDKLQELGTSRTDSPWSTLSAVPFVPAVLLWDWKVTAGVPSRYPAVGTWLLERVGHNFPLLGLLRHRRVIRTLATVIRDNLDPSQCNLSPSTKLLCGMVYATKAQNSTLAGDFRKCALFLGPHLVPRTYDLVAQFALEQVDFGAPSIDLSQTFLANAGPDLTMADRRALLLAKAGSTSPATITPVVLGGMDKLFSAPAIIEQLVWLSVCQLLHRLYLFYMDPSVSPIRDETQANE